MQATGEADAKGGNSDLGKREENEQRGKCSNRTDLGNENHPKGKEQSFKYTGLGQLVSTS